MKVLWGKNDVCPSLPVFLCWSPEKIHLGRRKSPASIRVPLQMKWNEGCAIDSSRLFLINPKLTCFGMFEIFYLKNIPSVFLVQLFHIYYLFPKNTYLNTLIRSYPRYHQNTWKHNSKIPPKHFDFDIARYLDNPMVKFTSLIIQISKERSWLRIWLHPSIVDLAPWYDLISGGQPRAGAVEN